MKVLVVEDSLRMVRVLERGLREEGYVVEHARDAETGTALARGGEFDLVLLDLGLPDGDGLDLIRALRERRSDVPVVVVTARSTIEDRVAGLDAGADDYVVKPFLFEELLARIRAVMRRPGSRSEPVLRFEDIELDPGQGRATRGGRSLELSAREFSLLREFMRHRDRVVGRAALYEGVWGNEYDGTSNVLDVYVNYLRRKLEAGGEPRVIHTLRGRGYLFGSKPSR